MNQTFGTWAAIAGITAGAVVTGALLILGGKAAIHAVNKKKGS